MQKRTICPLTCPMINAQGFCESSWRRAGQVREYPHDRLRRTTRRRRKKRIFRRSDGRDGRPNDTPLCLSIPNRANAARFSFLCPRPSVRAPEKLSRDSCPAADGDSHMRRPTAPGRGQGYDG